MSTFKVLLLSAMLSIDALGAVRLLAVHGPFSSVSHRATMSRSDEPHALS